MIANIFPAKWKLKRLGRFFVNQFHNKFRQNRSSTLQFFHVYKRGELFNMQPLREKRSSTAKVFDKLFTPVSSCNERKKFSNRTACDYTTVKPTI